MSTPPPAQTSSPFRVAGLLFFSLVLAVLISFILGAKKQTAYLRMKVAAPRDSRVQLFYDLGHGFSEKNSRQRSVTGTGRYLPVRFPLPRQLIKSLRLDFVSPTQTIEFCDIALVNGYNEVLCRYDNRNLTALHDIKTISIQGNGALIRSGGPDPQLSLGPDTSISRIYGFRWQFCLALTFLIYTFFWFLYRIACLLYAFRDSGFSGSCQGHLRGKTRIVHRIMVAGGFILIGAAAVFFLHAGADSGDKYQDGHQIIHFENFIAGEPVTIRSSDGIKIAGTIFKPPEYIEKTPGILLLHGNFPEGRNFPLYLVLAQYLAQKGYLVLTIDFAGYGASDDPFSLGKLESINMDLETRAALRFLGKRPELDRQAGITVIGHSMGADPTLSVGIENPAVRSLVLIGPPRRVQERFHFPLDRDLFWRWAHHVRKQVYGKEGFPEWYSMDHWLRQILERDMVKYLPYFAQWQHKPLLLIDGEREPGADKDFLRRYACRIAYPKKYVTLTQANHNCNVSARDGRITYDPVVMKQLVEEIDSWNRQSGKVSQSFWDWFGNILRRLFAVEVIQGC